MNEEITSESAKYAKINPQPEELERILKELGSRQLLNEYYAFLRTINFNSESTISFVQNGVRDLMNKVEEYKRKKEVFQINKSSILEIRESLIKRCPKKYISGKFKILELEKLGILLNLFDKGYSKLCDIEYFNLFDEITYEELEYQSNCVSAFLLQNGIVKNFVVPICIENDVDRAVAILAVLKCGAAYILIDPRDWKNKQSVLENVVQHRFLLGESENRKLFGENWWKRK